MTMTQVLYALEVARCQNVSRAAERLLLSQSALSQQLRRLEQELGYPIFTRTLHGVQLTPEGERFCEQAAGMARTWKEFQANVQKSALGIRKRLRIGMGSRAYSNDLFQQIAQFFEEHEDLDVAPVTEVGLDFISQLRRGTLDLALDRLPDTNIGALEKEFSICPLIREPRCRSFCRRTIRAAGERRSPSMSFRAAPSPPGWRGRRRNPRCLRPVAATGSRSTASTAPTVWRQA